MIFRGFDANLLGGHGGGIGSAGAVGGGRGRAGSLTKQAAAKARAQGV